MGIPCFFSSLRPGIHPPPKCCVLRRAFLSDCRLVSKSGKKGARPHWNAADGGLGQVINQGMTDPTDLQIFIAAVCINTASIHEITEMQVGESILKRCHRDENGGNLNLIKEATSKVTMRMSNLEAEDSVSSIHRDYLMAFRNAGYDGYRRQDHRPP